MYPSPGHNGCSYTGSSGGAKLTVIATCAAAPYPITNKAPKTTTERTQALFSIVVMLLFIELNVLSRFAGLPQHVTDSKAGGIENLVNSRRFPVFELSPAGPTFPARWRYAGALRHPSKIPQIFGLREGRLSPSAVPEERGALRLDRRLKTRPNFRRMCVPRSYPMGRNVLSRTAVGGVQISLFQIHFGEL